MNVVGIITEHNPFHNGHLYHVEKARVQCDAELVVSVMSGHFLQRGEPALFNKWARAKMAVLGGVDLVIELPTAFSVRSASSFALGAVSILNSMGVVTHLCFGTESGDVDSLWPAARLLFNEPALFKALLRQLIDTGMSYPAARAGAITRYLADTSSVGISPEIYAAPNNILGIEYLKSLLRVKSDIRPTTIKRFAAGYHDMNIDSNVMIASATSIREELQDKGELTGAVGTVVPEASLAVMKQEILAGRGPIFMNDYAKMLFYLLRSLPPEQIAEMYDVSEGLENRIMEISRSADSVQDLLSKLKTKRYTRTRLQRILSYILLGYTKSLAESFDLAGPRYIRVLGLSSAGRSLLKKVKKEADIPVITRTSPFLSQNDDTASMLKFDVKATDIYTLMYPGQGITRQGLDCKVMPFVGNGQLTIDN